MSGWLIITTHLGVDPDTRRMVELWAARVADAADAVAAVEKRSGVSEPPAETMCSLPDDVLTGLGLTAEGQVVRVRAEF